MENYKLQQDSRETLVGVETDRSFGRVLNPRTIMSQVWACPSGTDSPTGPHFQGKPRDSGNGDSVSVSSSSSSSYSSSSPSTDSGYARKKKCAGRKRQLKLKAHKDFHLKVEGVSLLTVTAVKNKFKQKKLMSYIVTGINTDRQNQDKVRIYDKILRINGKDLEDCKFDIDGLLNFTKAMDGVYNIEMELKRWQQTENEAKYHVKDVNVAYKISMNPSMPLSPHGLQTRTVRDLNESVYKEKDINVEYTLSKNPPMPFSSHGLQSRPVRGLRWTNKPRKVRLRMNEFTGLFVFLDAEDGNDLKICTRSPNEQQCYYHFFVRPFRCVVEDSTGTCNSKLGVTITYHHRGVYLDITSVLRHGRFEVVTKVHEEYDITNPDERYFLKHKGDSQDPDGQRYESLLYPNMCFKFDEGTNNFIMDRFGKCGRSLACFLFETFSVTDRSISINETEVSANNVTISNATSNDLPDVTGDGNATSSRLSGVIADGNVTSNSLSDIISDGSVLLNGSPDIATLNCSSGISADNIISSNSLPAIIADSNLSSNRL